MLAYVFWHRPRAHVAPAHYETALARFHAALAEHPPDGFSGSVRVRLDRAPWLAGEDAGPAYEDWYLVDGWPAIGRLDAAAVHGPRRTPHDAVAGESGHGTAGIYRRMLGAPRPTGRHATWFAKPDGLPYADLGAALDTRLQGRDASLWQRQMTLGPTPSLRLLAEAPVDLGGWRTVRRRADRVGLGGVRARLGARDRGHVRVVVALVGGAGDGALELAQAATERAPGVGQALRAEDHQRDHEDDQDLGDSDAGHHGW